MYGGYVLDCCGCRISFFDEEPVNICAKPADTLVMGQAPHERVRVAGGGDELLDVTAPRLPSLCVYGKGWCLDGVCHEKRRARENPCGERRCACECASGLGEVG